MASGGGLARVHVADDHDVDVGLLLSHPGYLDNQPERVSNVEEREVKGK